MPTLLIVDDEPNVRYSLEKYLRSQALDVVCAASGSEAIEKVRQRQPDAVVLDVRLPDMSGMEVFDRLRRIDPRLPVVMITAHATTEIAIEATKRGAFEYLLKPVDLHRLREVVAEAIHSSCLSRVPATFDQEESAETGADRIVGLCEAMQEVYKKIGRVAPQDVNVLILGESGTGKELVARAIHQNGPRAAKQFVSENCAAIPVNLLESEFFGHRKGAFTGAFANKLGYLDIADQGTLFLDEVGELTLSMQVKLLRAIDGGDYNPVGGNKPKRSDFRVIAATNRNLSELVTEGAMREDFFYRIHVISIKLPPLRERRDDIPILVDHFLNVYREEGKDAHIPAKILDDMFAYAWPGNVRELQNVIRRYLSVGRWDFQAPGIRDAGEPASHALRDAVEALEKNTLLRALEQSRWNKTNAARILGISRRALFRKMKKLQLS